jgi:hypothetical protein
MNEGKQDTRMTAYRIGKFENPDLTMGTVAATLTPVMRVGDDYVPFETERRSYRSLNQSFINLQMHASWGVLTWFCKAMVVVGATGAQLVAGTAKKAATSVLRKLLFKKMKHHFSLRARKRILKALYGKVGRTIGKGGKEFCKTFAKELVKLNVHKKILTAQGNRKKQLVRDPFIQAMSAFVKGIVAGLFGISVRKEIMTSPLLSKIDKEIATAVADRLFKGPTNVIVDTVSAAAEKAAADPKKKFSELVASELQKKPLEAIEKNLKDTLNYMAGKAS